MNIFIDTSAFYAIIDADDQFHEKARDEWVNMLNESVGLICSNYVLLETIALLQNRINMDAVRCFHDDIIPVIRIEWVDSAIHQSGVTALIAASRRELSLTDCISFALMRNIGLHSVFTFDKHYKEQGFKVLPNI